MLAWPNSSCTKLVLAEALVASPQQLSYLARAHYELGQYDQAEQTLRQIQERFPDLWADADRERLALYRRARKTGEALALGEETPAHAIYCESDWLLDKRGV